ncbi:MAG: tRNA (adenosine(37)-N6)-threonylcarbamoyltransferase complex transferase subunit TsaD [Minisyncoccia bacterium]
MIILGIETSCDETSVALLEAKKEKANFFIKPYINLLVSQIKIHEKYGGVVPLLANREHLKNLPLLFEKILKENKISLEKIDLIAVTNGPGLMPALLIGVHFSKTLAWYLDKPIIGVSHLTGHLLSFLLPPLNKEKKFTPNSLKKIFPLIGLIVSGGHTLLVYSKKIGDYKIIGETLDDASGECFDKTARILGLGYPGGPKIAQEAEKLKNKKLNININLPRPMINSKDYNFSFSGLKTAVLYLFNKLTEKEKKLYLAAIAYEIQEAITDVLAKKTLKAVKDFKVKTLVIGGGVSANLKLRQKLKEEIKKQNLKINFLPPILEYSTDNAIMIALAGFFDFLEGNNAQWKKLDANANKKL